MNIKLGILGATGKVGSELLKLLENWPESKLTLSVPPVLFGTEKSAGKKILFKNQELEVKNSIPENFEGLNVLISCANGEVSEKLVPEALRRGVKLVVDTDSFYRMDPDVPLVTIGVNDEDLDWHKGIIAGPNCSTAQLVLPLKALHKAFGLKRVVVSTYQSVSGAGKKAMDELLQQTRSSIESGDLTETETQRKLIREQFAFNVIPKISKILDSGYSKEEWKVVVETRKMLHSPDLAITCTAVRVPVLVGHSESVNVQLLNSFSLQEVTEVLKNHTGIKLWDDKDSYPMPTDVAGSEPVHVGRVRVDESAENALDLWVVADNLMIGAALNALRIAEVAAQRHKIWSKGKKET
ncbi:MAG: aspartate-semialdehyde dehydrogenase [Candidatus Caenarcaniphilales bacterium]|nr:aspartate-semialdehyde dehydrogenase [Candidatus Caenarcaniphilales bacterium]